MREFADAGVAVVVASAVGRTKDAKGRSSYAGEGLALASFRESSELEFGADDAFILHPDRDDDAADDVVRLRHLKARHGEARDLVLRFDRPRQRFVPAEDAGQGAGDRQRLTAALTTLWARTAPAREDENGGDL